MLPDIAVFVGQGVLVQGRCGVITKVYEEEWIKRDEVPPKAKTVEVFFVHKGLHAFVPVPVSKLERAVMPKAELHKIYEKHYPELLGEEGV